MSQPNQDKHKTKKIKKAGKQTVLDLQKADQYQILGSNTQGDNQPENSLSFLTLKFLQFVKKSSNCCLNIQKLALALNVSKRRVYDITNVLSAIGIINKSKKNEVTWRPDLPIFSANPRPKQNDGQKIEVLDQEEIRVLNFIKDYEDGILTNQQINIVKQSLNSQQIQQFAKFGEQIQIIFNHDPFEAYTKASKNIQTGQKASFEKQQKVMISQFQKLEDKIKKQEEVSKDMRKTFKKKAKCDKQRQSLKNQFFEKKKEIFGNQEDFMDLQILIADGYFEKLIHFVP